MFLKPMAKTPPQGGSCNKLGETFAIKFVERLHEGSPRWETQDYEEHVKEVPKLSRAREVNAAFERIYKRPKYMRGVELFRTCIDPECKQRTQEDFLGTADGLRAKSMVGTADDALEDLRKVSRAERDYSEPCEKCAQAMPVYATREIEDKFIYVLTGELRTGTLTLKYEVRAVKSGFGGVLEFPPGDKTANVDQRDFRYRLNSKTKRPEFFNKHVKRTTGVLKVTDPTQDTWHFFLSPIQLGPKALVQLEKGPELETKMLKDFYANQEDAARMLNEEDLKHWMEFTWQPWAVTVRRQFTLESLQEEIVPLLDPFAYAYATMDADYVPALEAYQTLLRHPEERAKATIAGALQSIIVRRVVKAGDPPEDETDPTEDEMDPHEIKKMLDPAATPDKWLDRHDAAMKFIGGEANKACGRLATLLRYSPAHRIVEVACQEQKDRPEFLSHGLMHWNVLLKDMLGRPRGEMYVAWLYENGKEHIPIKNVLNGEEVTAKNGAETKVVAEVGRMTLLQILGYLSPMIIRESGPKDAGEAMKAHLLKIGRPSISGIKELKLTKDKAIEIGEKVAQKYAAKIANEISWDVKVRGQARLNHASDVISAFKTLKVLEDAVNLLIGLHSYVQKPPPHETYSQGLKRKKDHIEYPLKVADFLMSRSQTLIAAGDDRVARLLKRWETDPRSLRQAERNIVSASRSLKLYTTFGIAKKIIAGPVSLIFGGMDLIVETETTVRQWRDGDTGAAFGHALAGAAAVCSLLVAGAETAALLSGASVAGWAGPVGWVAAAIAIGAAVVIWVWSLDALQSFAQHCWLGLEYGQGNYPEGPAWNSGVPLPLLRYTNASVKITEEAGLSSYPRKQRADRFLEQRLSLWRLISNYQIQIDRLSSFCGCWVYLNHVAPNAWFEVRVVIWPVVAQIPGRPEKKPKKEIVSGKVYPGARLWHMDEESPRLQPERGKPVIFYPSDRKVDGTKLDSPPPVRAFKIQWVFPWDVSAGTRYDVYVRLNMDGAGNYLPSAAGKPAARWVKVSSSNPNRMKPGSIGEPLSIDAVRPKPRTMADHGKMLEEMADLKSMIGQ